MKKIFLKLKVNLFLFVMNKLYSKEIHSFIENFFWWTFFNAKNMEEFKKKNKRIIEQPLTATVNDSQSKVIINHYHKDMLEKLKEKNII